MLDDMLKKQRLREAARSSAIIMILSLPSLTRTENFNSQSTVALFLLNGLAKFEILHLGSPQSLPPRVSPMESSLYLSTPQSSHGYGRGPGRISIYFSALLLEIRVKNPMSLTCRARNGFFTPLGIAFSPADRFPFSSKNKTTRNICRHWTNKFTRTLQIKPFPLSAVRNKSI